MISERFGIIRKFYRSGNSVVIARRLFSRELGHHQPSKRKDFSESAQKYIAAIVDFLDMLGEKFTK